MRLILAIFTFFLLGILPRLPRLLVSAHVSFWLLTVVGGQDILELLAGVPFVARLVAALTVSIPYELFFGFGELPLYPLPLPPP